MGEEGGGVWGKFTGIVSSGGMKRGGKGEGPGF